MRARAASCTAQAVMIDKITGNRVDIGTEGEAIPYALTKPRSVAVKDAAGVRRWCAPLVCAAGFSCPRQIRIETEVARGRSSY